MAGTIAIGKRLVAATHNRHKLSELAALLEPMGVELVPAAALELAEPEETEDTFAGNAILKAVAACEATGLPALSDDSGLVVDALDGAPGVHSARWGTPNRDFTGAMSRVLRSLPPEPEGRTARFVAVLALARPGHAPVTFEGVVEGTIADQPRGQGFGYDPIFMPRQGDGRTFGEMSAEEKAGGPNPLSHRARAVAEFAAAIVSSRVAPRASVGGASVAGASVSKGVMSEDQG